MMQAYDDRKLYESVTGNTWLDVGKTDLLQDQWYMVATSYKKAADLLVDGLPHNLFIGAESLYIACPIMFLYRHFLETGLKGLLLDLQALKKQKLALQSYEQPTLFEKLPSHPLMESWKRVKDLLVELVDEERIDPAQLEEGNAKCNAIEERINEFDAIDSDSFNFRYPADRDNSEATLSKLPDAQQLRRVKEIVSVIEVYFGSFATWAHEERMGIAQTWHQHASL